MRPVAGRLQGGAADQHGEHGVLLLRHGRGHAPPGDARFGELGDFRPAEEQDVGGHLSGRVGHGRQRVAERGHGQPVGVPGGRNRGETQAGGQPVGEVKRAPRRSSRRRQDGAGGQGPGRAAGLYGQFEGLEPAGRGGEPVEPLRGPQPEAVGQRVLGQAAGHTKRVPRAVRRGRRGPPSSALSSASSSRTASGGQHHQGRVEHVLAGQRGVNGPDGTDSGGVQGPDLLPEVGEQRDDGVAAALGADGEVRDVVAAARPRRRPPPRRTRPGRGRPRPGPPPRRPRPGGWRRARPGPRSAPPRAATPTRDSGGQNRPAGRRRRRFRRRSLGGTLGAARSPGTPSRPSPWRRMSQVSPPSGSRRAIRVRRRSGSSELTAADPWPGPPRPPAGRRG